MVKERSTRVSLTPGRCVTPGINHQNELDQAKEDTLCGSTASWDQRYEILIPPTGSSPCVGLSFCHLSYWKRFEGGATGKNTM